MKRFIFLSWFPVLLFLAACGGSDAVSRPVSPTPLAWTRPEIPISPENAPRLTLAGVLEGHTSTVYRFGQNANSQRLATLGGDARFVVWNMASGRTLLLATDLTIADVHFLPDGEHVLTLDSEEVLRRWSLVTGQQTMQTRIGQPADSISASRLSPDGSQLFVGLTNGSVLIYETQSLNLQDQFFAYRGGFSVQALYFAEAGRVLVTLGSDGNILRWEVGVWENPIVLSNQTPPPQTSTQTVDGRLLAVGRAGRVEIFDLVAGQRLLELETPEVQRVRQLLFSADGTWLALGGDFDSVLVFEVATGDLVVGLQGHGTGLSELAFSPDKRLLATGLGGSGVFLWDLSSLVGQVASASPDQVQIPRAALGEKVPGLSLSAMTWANDGSYLALADRFGKVYVLRAQP